MNRLQEKLKDALHRGDYVKASRIQAEIARELSRSEKVSLQSITSEMTQEDGKTAMALMHKMFVFADILYGAAVDFEEHIKKFDKNISIDVANQAKKAAQICRGITRHVDSFNSEELSEDFGKLCDEIQLIAMNAIYKREVKFNKSYEQRNNLPND